MPRNFIYLINPISGTKDKQSLRNLIEKKNRQRGFSFEILPTVADGNYRFLEQKIITDNITDIVICGGDGSVNQAVNSLAQLPLNFGIIPRGSGNGLALSARIPRNAEKALDIIFEGKAIEIDAFRINQQFACMLCGVGFDAHVAHEFAQQPKRGLSTYAAVTTRNFFAAKPFPFTVEANKLRFSTEAYFISIANSNQFGNNFTIAPQALLSDGLLDVVIVKKMAKPMLILNVMKQVLTGQIRSLENSMRSPVIYFQTESLKINNPENAPLHIDGEPRESMNEMEISILPRYFRLIHGA